MTEMVDYDEEDLHYRLFKSPFERLPLVGCRPRLRKNAAKRTLRLVGSSNPGYIRLCEEAAFGDFHDDESDR